MRVLLIAQAVIKNITILSADSVFKNYNVKTIW